MTMPENTPPVSLFTLLDRVIELVRADEQLSRALDAYPAGRENANARWFRRVDGYEVTLRFGAEPLR